VTAKGACPSGKLVQETCNGQALLIQIDKLCKLKSSICNGFEHYDWMMMDKEYVQINFKWACGMD